MIGSFDIWGAAKQPSLQVDTVGPDRCLPLCLQSMPCCHSGLAAVAALTGMLIRRVQVAGSPGVQAFIAAWNRAGRCLYRSLAVHQSERVWAIGSIQLDSCFPCTQQQQPVNQPVQAAGMGNMAFFA